MASIKLNDVSIDFSIFGGQKSFRKALFDSSRKTLFKSHVGGTIRQEESSGNLSVAALQNISLDIKDGDRLGLIGPNGAGKTTLLRLMAGIYHPTRGTMVTEGNISSLFSPGVGMDPEDTGYDNIYTCGLYLGLSNKEIEDLIPDIEEFTELGDYLAIPVRTYSTGMMVRLAFAITTAIHPEILLLDEGLGAGDARFASKAEERVNALIGRASIIVIASHSEGLIRQMCNKAIFLEEGKMIASGPVDEVMERYLESSQPVEG